MMKNKSVRLFKNGILESLTHVHPIVPLLFWSPVIVFLIWRALFVFNVPLSEVLMLILPGLLVWSLTEYMLHRYVFHFPAKSKAGKWLVYLFHGVHHDTPDDKTRLVMPPAGAVIVMTFLWLLFSLVVPAPWLEPFCAFFIVGYLIYDYIHYATHHFRMRSPLSKALKRYHMQHHFSKEGVKYGVSSPLWDWIFRTVN